MARITTSILVFMILLNGTVGIMAASGLSDDLGVDLAPGVSQTVEDAVDQFRQGFSPSSGLGETLFALFIGAIRVFQIAVETVLAMPSMLINLGFPDWLVIPFSLPLYALSTLEIVAIATGRRTI